jgi:DNA mismatch repair ATPase MutL
VVRKKTSVGDTVADLFKEKKKELSDDLFDVSTFSGLVNISLSRIVEDKNQPRKTFNSQTIKELASSNPHFCPHQRPIFISFSLGDIEKLLKRR